MIPGLPHTFVWLIVDRGVIPLRVLRRQPMPALANRLLDQRTELAIACPGSQQRRDLFFWNALALRYQQSQPFFERLLVRAVQDHRQEIGGARRAARKFVRLARIRQWS